MLSIQHILLTFPITNMHLCNCLALNCEKLNPHVVILGNLLFNLLFITIIKDCEHEIKQHVETDHQECYHQYCGGVVHFPEWEQDVREVGGGEHYVDVEYCRRYILKILRRIIIEFIRKQRKS